jgi:hypothetical protein
VSYITQEIVTSVEEYFTENNTLIPTKCWILIFKTKIVTWWWDFKNFKREEDRREWGLDERIKKRIHTYPSCAGPYVRAGAF